MHFTENLFAYGIDPQSIIIIGPEMPKVVACPPARALNPEVVRGPSVPAAQSRPCTVTGRGGRESKRHRALSHSALTLPPPHAGHIDALGVLISCK